MPNQKNIEIEIAGREINATGENGGPKSFRIYWKSGDMRPDFKIYWPSRDNNRTTRGKSTILDELEGELVKLGMLEGNKVECSSAGNTKCESAYSGVLRKKINEQLIMEYTFSYPYGGVKNFHLNNVPVDLNDVEEEKLKKLLSKIENFNYKHEVKSKKIASGAGKGEPSSSQKILEKQKKKQAEILRKL